MRVVLALLLGSLGLAAPVAAAPRSIALRVEGECPARAALEAALELALPSVPRDELGPRPAGGARGAPPVEVAVTDGGVRYAVVIDGAGQGIEDRLRDCEGRARAAALLVALAIDPLALPPRAAEAAGTPGAAASPPAPIADGGAPARPASPPPSRDGSTTSGSATAASSPPAPAARATRPGPAVDLGLALAGALAPGSDGLAPGLGGALRLRLAWGAWGGTVGAALLWPEELRGLAGGVRASVLRVRVDLGLDLALRRPRLELAGQVGLALSPFWASGEGLAVTRSGPGFDLGARLAVELRLRLGGRLWLTLGLEAQLFPSPAALRVNGAGQVGSTPAAWLGAGLGLAWRLR